jgi:predicted phage tail protein
VVLLAILFLFSRENPNGRHSRRERRIGALLVGLIATALGVLLLTVSLFDGIQGWAMAGGTVFAAIGIIDILISRVFGGQAKS